MLCRFRQLLPNRDADHDENQVAGDFARDLFKMNDKLCVFHAEFFLCPVPGCRRARTLLTAYHKRDASFARTVFDSHLIL